MVQVERDSIVNEAACAGVPANPEQASNAVATVIPVHGDLRQPDVQIIPSLLAVLRNAFVEGLSASLANLRR